MSIVLGIDLGTTNSCVAVLQSSQPEIIINEQGGRTTASVVGKTGSGDWLVGEVARRKLATDPATTITSIKRLMGMRYDEIPFDFEDFPYTIVRGEHNMACVEIEGEIYSPVEISAMILRTLRESAEQVLGEEVSQAVITVPAYFNDAQRQATKDAGRVAGLEVLRIINEPTAASLAYGYDKGEDQYIAVYDLGGGTFDISILHLGDGVFEVCATGGDTHLGGDDIDQAIVDWLVGEFKKEHDVNLVADQSLRGRLKEAAEKAKCDLSSSLEAHIQLPFITNKEGQPLHLEMNLSRARFQRIIQPIVDGTLESCLKVLDDAHLTPLDINEVILVGGSTRVPAVQHAVEELFGNMPNKTVNPDEVVALGAAIQAGVLEGEVENVLLLDVTPLSLGIETLGGVVTRVIERNSTIPTRETKVFSTAADDQASVNIQVVQGEREMAIDNRSLGRFELSGIPLAKKGIPQIEVTFDIDTNGILQVSAKDLGTGKAQQIRTDGSSKLSEEEIQEMLAEAKQRAEDDHRRRRLVEIRHKSEALLLDMEDSMSNVGAAVSGEDRRQIEEGCKRLEKLIQTEDDPRVIEDAMNELKQISHSMAQALYR